MLAIYSLTFITIWLQSWKTYASVWIHEKDRHSRIGIKRKKVAGVTGAFKVHYLVFPDGPLFKGLLQQVMVKAATNINSSQASLHQNGHLLTKGSNKSPYHTDHFEDFR